MDKVSIKVGKDHDEIVVRSGGEEPASYSVKDGSVDVAPEHAPAVLGGVEGAKVASKDDAAKVASVIPATGGTNP